MKKFSANNHKKPIIILILIVFLVSTTLTSVLSASDGSFDANLTVPGLSSDQKSENNHRTLPPVEPARAEQELESEVKANSENIIYGDGWSEV